MLGYFEDGPNLVALAVNAWADAEPAWWLNLQAHPDAVVELKDGSRPVRARAAEGDERARLWARWRDLGERSGEAMIANCDAYAARLHARAGGRGAGACDPDGRRTTAGLSRRRSPRRRAMTASRDPGGMYVRESGSPGSPAILFIHGAGQSGREWRDHMARLRGFHCLAPDLPGHGRSNRLPLPSRERPGMTSPHSSRRTSRRDARTSSASRGAPSSRRCSCDATRTASIAWSRRHADRVAPPGRAPCDRALHRHDALPAHPSGASACTATSWTRRTFASCLAGRTGAR